MLPKRKIKPALAPTWPMETEVMITRAEQEIREKDCNDFGIFRADSEQCVNRPVHDMCKYMVDLRRTHYNKV